MAAGHNGSDFDLIVVGAGIFGLSTAWEAALRGRRTLVVERRTIPNPIAASYGPSRKIRTTYLDPHYARLAHEAMAAWRRVEAEVSAELYITAGNLAFTSLDDPDTTQRLDALKAAALAAGSEIQDLDRPALQSKFPQLKRAQRGLFETQAGVLRATACVEALQTLASRQGVEFSTQREVEAIETAPAGLAVRAGDQTYQAPQVVLAGGGWSNRLCPELGRALWQCQQGIMYIHDVPVEFGRPAFAPFSGADSGFYGFPAEDGVGLKVAQHVLGEPLGDPDFDRSSTPLGFAESASRFLHDELGLNVADYPVTFDSCMYNLSRSNDFLLDFHSEVPGLFIATAGSGHGFKFGSMLGTIVLDRLDGVASDRWSPHFSYAAFLKAPPAPRPL